MTDLEVRAGVRAILQKVHEEAPNGQAKEQSERMFKELIELFARADAEKAREEEQSRNPRYVEEGDTTWHPPVDK